MQLARLRARDLVVVALAGGPATIAAISDQTGITDAAVDWHIGRLEAAGLVEFAGFTRADRHRRRAKLFKVTKPLRPFAPLPPKCFPWRQYHDRPLCPRCGQPDAVHDPSCRGVQDIPTKWLEAARRLGSPEWRQRPAPAQVA